MNKDNSETTNNFFLIFVAIILFLPVIGLLMDFPSSIFVFKKVAELLNADFIESEGRYLIAAINIVVIILLCIKKYRVLVLKFSLALLVGAIIAHILLGVQLPSYGEAQTSMYGMISVGDYFSGALEANNYGFSTEYVIVTPDGFNMFVPEGYDSGFSFVLYLLGFGLNFALLNNNKPVKVNDTLNE